VGICEKKMLQFSNRCDSEPTRTEPMGFECNVMVSTVCVKTWLIYPIIDAWQSKYQPEKLTIPASSKR